MSPLAKYLVDRCRFSAIGPDMTTKGAVLYALHLCIYGTSALGHPQEEDVGLELLKLCQQNQWLGELNRS